MKIFKNWIQTILLGVALWICLWFGLGQIPALAATLTETPIAQERGYNNVKGFSLSFVGGKSAGEAIAQSILLRQ